MHKFSAEPKLSILDLSDTSNLDMVQAARQFSIATSECGFVYVRISSKHATIIEAVRRQQRRFFDLSPDSKVQIAIDKNNRGYLAQGEALMAGAKRADQKEVFFWGRETAADDPDYLAGVPLCGPNQWPIDHSELRPAIEAYSAFIANTGDLLLRIIALSLGADPNFFAPFYERSMLRGQLLRYPPTDSDPEQFGVAPHSDFGCITLLLQETNGLEVMFPDGSWVAAPPIENTLIINIGDLLERWSNNKLPSTKHRVRNTSTDPRYSIAMFYDPSPQAIVDPADLLSEETPKFAAIGAAEYILSRNKKSFAHYK